MPEPTLIQEQRSLLRNVHHALTEWIQAKKAADARLQHEQKAAEEALHMVREEAAAGIKKVEIAFTYAQSFIEKSSRKAILDEVVRQQPDKQQEDRPSISPAQAIDDALALVKFSTEEVRSIEAWFEKTKKESEQGWWLGFCLGPLILLIAGGAVVGGFIYNPALGVLAVAALIALIVWGLRSDYSKFSAKKAAFKQACLSLMHAHSDAEWWYSKWLQQAQAYYEAKISRAQDEFRQAVEYADGSLQRSVESIVPDQANITKQVNVLSLTWDSNMLQEWSVATNASLIVRFGSLHGTDKLKSNISMPAILAYPGERSLLVKSEGAAKAEAIKAIQSLLLRLLASTPSGKLRFTFIDPVGLGQNVAPFMHLADYDDQLVTSKAWTEPQHIEQRLADLIEYLENVIQKYLRNQFATIEEYNAQTGEVAEPYRVLVVFDFPANFSETAARRLVSIAQNGPRCGVYTIVLVDTAQPLPHGFNMADLERASTVIAWNAEKGHFVWEDEDFKDCVLTLDAPPPAELFDRIVKAVGEQLKAKATPTGA